MQPFIAEIRMFCGNFAPKGWAFCDGQSLPITQNAALFSLIGTYYGGNGISTFNLPDLRGVAALGVGAGQGLTVRTLGETGGAAAVTLTESNMAPHTHPVGCTSNPGAANSLSGGVWATAAGSGQTAYASALGTPASLAPQAVASSGGGVPHNNMPPYLALSFIIALEGLFPPRN